MICSFRSRHIGLDAMASERITTPGSSAMEKVAEHYALELNAQFRTLNHFVKHAGEIGRAHEIFLRSVLARFLPGDVKLGTGFVASPLWTSRQQDILIYKRDLTTLLNIGDCTVIDHEAFIGAIEVKTQLDSSSALRDVIDIQAEFRNQMHHRGLYAIYTWEAISWEKAIDTLWDFVRAAPTKNYDSMPDIVYVKGGYLLMANRDGHRDSPPYHIWHIRDGEVTEGQALLGLVTSVWRFGLMTLPPWWLLSWHRHLGLVAGKSQEVLWPNDLKEELRTGE